MSILLQDLRSAWRAVRVRPGLAAVQMLTLGLGIGAAAAVFVLLDAAVLRALPFRDPGRLVWMWNARVERGRAPFSIPDLADYQAGSRVLDGLAPFSNWTANLIGVGEAERLEGLLVAPGFFTVLGVDAALGRVPGAGDDPASKVVVLTDRLWRRRFGADPGVVGRTINLNGTGYLVVAVLPRGFVFPFRTAELAVPLALATNVHRGQRGYGFLRVVARLRPGVTIAAARADLDAIGRRLRQQYPDDDGKKTGVNLFPLRQMPASEAPLVAARTYWVARVDGDPLAVATAARAEVRRLDGDIATSGPRTLRQVRDDALEARRFSVTLLSLFGQAAALLAAMGIYAVTAFAVGRRTREIGVRVACGATGRDIVSMIVAAEYRGVAVGLAIGLVAAEMAARLVARTLYQVDPLDPWTLALTTGVLASVGALASYVPARRALRVDPVEALRAD